MFVEFVQPSSARILRVGPSGPGSATAQEIPKDAVRELTVVFSPDATGTNVVVLCRSWRGSTRWVQRLGLVRLSGTRADWSTDTTRALSAALSALAATLDA